MPRMVHFSAGICLSDCGVLQGFLEEFLRRAGIRTLLKWGSRSTRKSYLSSQLASFLGRFNNATTRADSGLSPLPSDLSRRCSKLLGWMCPMQVGNVKSHVRLTATHALNGLAASVWDRASKARIGITLAGQKAAGVVVLGHERIRP